MVFVVLIGTVIVLFFAQRARASALTQAQLAQTLMPLGTFTKDRTRELAEQWRLPVAHKPARLPESAKLLPATMARTAATEPNSNSSSAATQATEAKNTTISSTNACR